MIEIDFPKIFNTFDDDWIFNSLGIECFSKTSKSRLRHWFWHLSENHDKIQGDIFEFGVYKGGGTIAMGILLKLLKSDKKVYAFDSFSGFPDYHENDKLEMFHIRKDLFDEMHRCKAVLCKDIAGWRLNTAVDPSNISTSGDFSDTSYQYLVDRIAKFGLDNIVLIEGAFQETLPRFFRSYKGTIFSANIDCDLYSGYRACLENIYDRCNSSAMIYLDEYYSLKFPGARIAVEEFLVDKTESVKLLSKDENDFERWAILKN